MSEQDHYDALAGLDPEIAAGAMLVANTILIEMLAGSIFAQLPEAHARLVAGSVEMALKDVGTGTGHPDIDMTRRRDAATRVFINRTLQAALKRAAKLRAGRTT